MSALLEVRGLTKRFGGVLAVSDVSFDVGEGDIVAIIGPNGAGKTTLINLITGVHRPDHGSAVLGGTEVAGASIEQLVGLGVARTFQHPRIFTNMTVEDNVVVASYHRMRVGLLSAALHFPAGRRAERTARESAWEALELAGLDCAFDLPADSLTPGQDKLLELARSLATGARLLFLDEPAAGLDDHETAELARRISEINRQGRTIVLVEHNMPMVMSLAHRIVVMDSGEKIADGTPAEVRGDPRVIEAYLGHGSSTRSTVG